MTGCTFTLAYDHDCGQVVLEDLPAGPAGEAGLAPVEGIELLFDRADGRLVRVFAHAGLTDGSAVIGRPALTFVTSLFGAEAGAAIERVCRADGAPVSLRLRGDNVAGLSRLARLAATRLTSPASRSPWWAVEAAQLAARAGLGLRADAETQRAVKLLDGVPETAFAGVPAAGAVAVAELVDRAAPGMAKRLREHAILLRQDQPAPARPDRAWPAAVPPQIAEEGGHGISQGTGLRWSLDPQTIPAAVFRHHVWPSADLTVRPRRNGIAVEAELVPGADRSALAGCRVRLVDPARRTVIAMAPFRDAGGCRVRAEIPGPVPSCAAWVEVVNDAGRPVLSEQLRHIRRAVRWADAALWAGRQRAGQEGDPDPRWGRLARLGWQWCAGEWTAAGDPDRAYLAAVYGAAAGADAMPAAPPSAWAKELAGRPVLREPPFIAEMVG